MSTGLVLRTYTESVGTNGITEPYSHTAEQDFLEQKENTVSSSLKRDLETSVIKALEEQE